MSQKVLLKKSSVVNKTPSVNSIEFGELAVNYASGTGKAFLATKKYDGTIAKFHEDTYNEDVFATKSDVSEIESDIQDIKGKYALSGVVFSAISAINATIEDDEFVTATALNEMNDRIDALEEATGDISGEYLTIASATQVFNQFSSEIGDAETLAQSAYTYADSIKTGLTANYYTTAQTNTQIANASARTVGSAKTYVDNNFVKNSVFATYSSTTDSSISDLEGDVSFIQENYALSAVVSNEISELDERIEEDEYVISAALNSLNERIGNVSGSYMTYASATSMYNELSNEISNASTKAQSAYTYADGINTNLTTNYAKHSEVSTASANSIVSATTSAVSYANATFVKQTAYTQYTGSVSSELSILAASARTVSGNVIALSGAIVSKLTSVYRYKGTKTNASQLPTTGNEDGDVWNVVNASGDTPAGTNYAWVKEGSGGHWDALGGSIDLSGFFTSAAAVSLESRLSSADSDLQNKIDAVSGTVESNYALSSRTQAVVDAAVVTAINSAYTMSTGYTKDVTDAISGSVNAYKTANDSIVNSLKDGLSAWTHTNAATHTEVKTASGNAVTAANTYTDNKVKMLSGLTSGTFLTIASANSIVTSLNNSIDGVNNSVTGLSASVMSNYAISSRTQAVVDAAVIRAINSAYSVSSAYTNNVGDAISGAVNSYISSNDSAVNALKTGLSAWTHTNAATHTEVKTASGNAVTAANTYTDTKFNLLSGLTSGTFLTVSSANTIVTTLNNSIDGVNNSLTAFSATVVSDYATETEASTYAATALGNAMAYTDSKISDLSIGNYVSHSQFGEYSGNVSNQFDTTKKSINIVSGSVSALSASVVTNYVDKTLLNTTSANVYNSATAYTNNNAITHTRFGTYSANVSSDISALNTGLSAWTHTNAATHTEVKTASGNAVTAANTYTDSKFNLLSGLTSGTFLTVSSANTIVTTLNNSINGVDTKVDTLSASVIANYATEAKASTYAAAALGNAMDYTDSKISGLSIGNYVSHTYFGTYSGDVSNQINGVSNYAAGVSANVKTLSGKVVTDYATKALVATTSSSTVGSAKTYADANFINHTRFSTYSGDVSNQLSKISTVSASVITLSGNVVSKLSTVFKYKGTVQACTNLPNNAETGDTWNVTSASGNTPAGTNWTWNGSSWDPLGGTVDLSGYFTAASAGTAYSNLSSEIDDIRSSYALSASVNSRLVEINENIDDIFDIIEEDEETTAAALNDLNSRLINFDGVVSDLGSTYLTVESAASIVSDMSSELNDVPILRLSAATLNNKFGEYAYSSITHNEITAATDSVTKVLTVTQNGTSVGTYNGTAAATAATTDKQLQQERTNAAQRRALLLGTTTAATGTALATTTVTGTAAFNETIYAIPSTGKLYAGGFSLTGGGTNLLTADGGSVAQSSFVPTGRTVNGHALSGNISVTASDVGLGNVENTKLSTWTGNTSIASVGTVTAGTWNATPVALNRLAKSAITVNGTSVALGGSVDTPDKKVGQASNTAANYRPIILGTNNHATAASIPTTSVTGETVFNAGVYVQPSTKKIFAAGFQLTAGTANVLIGDGTSEARSNFATSSITHNEITAATANVTKVLTINQNGAQLTTYNGTTAVTANTTDANVKQENNTVATYRPLLMGSTTNAAPTSLTATTTGQTYVNAGIYAQPSTGELNAKQMRISEKVTLQYNSTTEALDFIFS